MPRFVDDRRDCTLFVDGTLDSLLPANSVARVLWDALEQLDFSLFEQRYVNEARGRRAIDPRRLVSVWILSLLRGNTSSVVLADLCGRDLEFRWLMGDASVQKSTLSDFRKNYLNELADLSTQVLALLARMGLLASTHVCVDGTVIRAASSCSANCTRKKLKARIKRLKKRVQETLAQPEAPNEALAAQERRKRVMEQALEEMTQLGLTGEKDRLTLTEPDAPKRKLKTGNFAPAHNVQVAADLDSGAILEAAVIDQGNDQGQLAPQLEGIQDELERVSDKLDEGENLPDSPRAIAADSAYHDTLQLDRLERQGIETFVPDRGFEYRASGVTDDFVASRFQHDEANDIMVCPMGHPMKRRKLNENKTAMTYQAEAATCRACPHKPHCCPKAKGGRSVNRSLYSELLERVHQRTQSERGQRFKNARFVSGEGAIGRLVERLTWRRCRTWGMQGAQAEAKWRQIAHNIMLMMKQWQPLVLKEGLA